MAATNSYPVRLAPKMVASEEARRFERRLIDASRCLDARREGQTLSHDLIEEAVESPGKFVHDVLSAWRAFGPREKSQFRHSDRGLERRVKDQGAAISSAQHKIKGDMPITQGEARAILTSVFQSWKWDESAREDVPLSVGGPVRTAEDFSDILFRDQDKIRISGATRISAVRFVKEQATQADALIVASRTDSFTGQSVPLSFMAFRELIQNFAQPRREREGIHIWVLDYGDQNVSDILDYTKFVNVQLLAAVLRACFSFENKQTASRRTRSIYEILQSPEGEARQAHSDGRTDAASGPNSSRTLVGSALWRGLAQRCCVVLRNAPLSLEVRTRLECEDGNLDDEKEQLRIRSLLDELANIDVEHFIPTGLPEKWKAEKQTKELFSGYEMDAEPLNVAVKVMAEFHENRSILNTDIEYYCLPGSSRRDQNGHQGDNLRLDTGVVKIPSPGRIYEDAIGLIYTVARHRMAPHLARSPDEIPFIRNGRAAVALRQKGFECLRLPDFLDAVAGAWSVPEVPGLMPTEHDMEQSS